MISPEYVSVMAKYNEWQNNSLYREANLLDAKARGLGRGAFFGSIHQTLAHILWGDQIWMHRFEGWDMPPQGFPEHIEFPLEWEELCKTRTAFDVRISDWAEGLKDADLSGDLTWYSGATQRDVTRPKALLVSHMFNHQTHHRGQVHAMLTAAGAKPDDTDLPFLGL